MAAKRTRKTSVAKGGGRKTPTAGRKAARAGGKPPARGRRRPRARAADALAPLPHGVPTGRATRPAGLPASVRVHPMALVESASVGEGTRIWAFAHVLRGARIGARCNVCEGAFIEGQVVVGDGVTIKNGVALWDGVTVEDEAFLGPGCAFTNDLRPRSGRHKRPASSFLPTRIGRGASIGANATVVCGHTVGSYAMVAAGAVVSRDVPAHALVAGVPARAIGFVCACGERLAASLRCACGLAYERDGEGLRSRGR